MQGLSEVLTLSMLIEAMRRVDLGTALLRT